MKGEYVLNVPGRIQRLFKVGMWSGEESIFNADLFLFELVDAYFKLLWHIVISGLLVFLCQSQPQFFPSFQEEPVIFPLLHSASDGQDRPSFSK